MNQQVLRDVLIADDNEYVRNAIAAFLSTVGLEVDTVANGREALERLMQVQYAVMLLDYEMPELDGIGVVNALREVPKRPVVFMMTGYENIEALPIDGSIVQAILPKPFEIADLADIIQRCVAGARTDAHATVGDHHTD